MKHPPETSVDLCRVRAVLLDVDGTMYRQGPVRLAMLWGLARQALTQGGLRDLMIVREYRRRREADAGVPGRGALEAQFADVASASGEGIDRVEQVVVDWILRRPLAAVARSKRGSLVAFLEALAANGIRTAACSDYPAADKLAALGVSVDVQVSAVDEGVRVTKPDPLLLLEAARELGTAPDACLVIGDRLEMDGAAAAAAGMQFVLVVDDATFGELTRRLTASRAPATGGRASA